MSRFNRRGPDTVNGPDEGTARGYTGSPVFREGGVRAGGVSALETMPATYPYPKKQGYDEHRRVPVPGGETIHGLPGVEGIPESDEENGPDSDGDGDGDGYACGVGGCGFTARTPHGLAKHAHAMHGATARGHALRR